MDSDHVLVLFLGLVLVGAAVALALSFPAAFGGDSEGIGGATLASFETTDVYCGDPNTTSGSAVREDISGGEALVLNRSLPVASNDTTVSASFEEFGPQRYLLEITSETPEATPTETPRPETATPTSTPVNGTATNGSSANQTTAAPTPTSTAANETESNGTGSNGTATSTEVTPTPTPTETGATCHPEIQYNATIHIAQPDEYTVVVTYDGEFVAGHWRDGDDDGTYDTLPERPETESEANETAATVGSASQDR
ncbi:hypothetical protein SAMN05216559_2016 [Halomicrobium zhouii]|uniref:Uncharacterized protein n=1 Tax=Halomicrobium zhouii TaxID=767519 RepID=A0A1I6L4I4_9EURY|nr:hypothetical protein [Halomicrobium zhouii]SFR98344.1 hypothetical protein SAMN05216559_2016 [Halomicrobium zhouii]